jgi:hypothetical protein
MLLVVIDSNIIMQDRAMLHGRQCRIQLNMKCESLLMLCVMSLFLMLVLHIIQISMCFIFIFLKSLEEDSENVPTLRTLRVRIS